MNTKDKVVEIIRSISIGDKDYPQYVEAIAEKVADKWIPVEERLPDPKEYDWVLVNVQANEDGSYYVPRTAELRNGEWWEYGTDWKISDMHLTVTHWMPLPEYPRRNKYGS